MTPRTSIRKFVFSIALPDHQTVGWATPLPVFFVPCAVGTKDLTSAPFFRRLEQTRNRRHPTLRTRWGRPIETRAKP